MPLPAIERKSNGIKIVKINVAQNNELTENLGIYRIPIIN
jgi:hypothetical protein